MIITLLIINVVLHKMRTRLIIIPQYAIFVIERKPGADVFVLPYTCSECLNDANNYRNTDENIEDIIYIDSNRKEIVINELTELKIIDDTKELEQQQNIDAGNFKDALLASLYSQVEFLKQAIVAKDRGM